jgi:hypothetical protein
MAMQHAASRRTKPGVAPDRRKQFLALLASPHLAAVQRAKVATGAGW